MSENLNADARQQCPFDYDPSVHSATFEHHLPLRLFSISEFSDDQITTTPSYDCSGKDDGLYPDPEDCHNFFECSNERSLFFTCPDGLAFDDAAHACNFEDLVPACNP